MATTISGQFGTISLNNASENPVSITSTGTISSSTAGAQTALYGIGGVDPGFGEITLETRVSTTAPGRWRGCMASAATGSLPIWSALPAVFPTRSGTRRQDRAMS